MPRTLGRQTGRFVLIAILAVAGMAHAAAVSGSDKPAPRAKLLAERDRFSREATTLEQQKKYAEAIAAAEKRLAIERQLFGATHADVASSLEQIGRCHLLQGDFDAARKALKDREQVVSKLYGDRDWRVTDARLAVLNVETVSRLSPEQRRELQQANDGNLQVGALYRKGDFRKAIAMAEQVAEVRRRLLGLQHPDTAESLNNLAVLYDSMGDYAKAEPLCRQALGIDKKVLGDEHPDTAQSLNNLAFLYASLGDYAKAEPLYRQALEIRRRVLGNKHPDTATSLNNLASLYYSMGDYAKAEPLYRQALEIKRRVLGNKHPDTAQSLNSLAALYQSMGDYAKAELLYRQALEINKKVLGDKHPDTATSLNNLASLYYSMGDYAKAEPLYRQALVIRRKVLGEKHPDTAQSLNNLAALYQSMGDYAKAEPLYRQALVIRRKVLGEKHPDTAASLNNLAALYQSMGDYAKAEPLYRQALEIWRKVLGDNYPYTATSLNNLATLYKSTGNYAKAEPAYRQALDIRRKVLGDKHPDTASSLNSLALLYESMGDYAKAERLCRQALEIYEKHFVNTLQVQSEQQQLAMAKLLRFNLDAYLTIAADAKVSAADLYRHALAWKGAIFMRQLDSRALRGRPELRPQFDELASLDVRLSTLALRGPRLGQREAWERQMNDLTERKESLERKLSQQSAQFREQQALKDPTLEDLQHVLPLKAALVDVLEYWHHRPSSQKPGQLLWERRLAAFVVRHDRPVVRIELGPVKPLAAATENWRRAILQDGGGAEAVAVNSAGSEKPPQLILKEAIWEPLKKEIEGAEIVLVSPDGVLNQVPLAALPGQKPGSYLVEEIELAVVPVPRLLLRKEEVRPDKAGGQSLLVVGDVNYGGSPGKTDAVLLTDRSRSAVRGDRAGGLRFPPLDYSRTEMATIRDSFEKDFPDGKVTPLRGGQATEAAFRRDAPAYRWLHLATHGFFAPPGIASALAPSKEDKERGFGQFGRQGIAGYHPGLLSGLAFSGANTPGGENEDDGILTAVEVAGLDLERTELVVLSACETGLGSVAGGEGVLGLQRAFQLSGAKTTVTSLWTIPDRATMQLMQRFYENLWDKKMSKLDALREAQIWMLKEGRQRGLDLEEAGAKKPASGRLPPRYWAAFVLSGDWR